MTTNKLRFWDKDRYRIDDVTMTCETNCQTRAKSTVEAMYTVNRLVSSMCAILAAKAPEKLRVCMIYIKH